jgi:23S rRNA G2445 N2-methylase RlmL
LEFHAICGEGLVDLLKSEMEPSHLEILSENRGGVFFRGNPNHLFEFFLKTEVSSRIGFTIASFSITEPDEFYKAVKKLPWENILNARTKFSIESRTKDCLPDSRFAQYRCKDAILDRFRDLELPMPDVGKENSDIAILLRSFLNQVRIELLLDPSSLTKRGYRESKGDANLRENIAAGLLKFSGWKENQILIDPFCGNGTILIEAALQIQTGGYRNAERLDRSYIFRKLFPKETYPLTPRNPGPGLGTEALSSKLFGFDQSAEAIERAIQDAKKAGVSKMIQWIQGDLSTVSADQFRKDEKEVIHFVTDPPFGKRLGTREEAAKIYSDLGKILKSDFRNSELTLITGDPSLLGYLKLKKSQEMGIRNSSIKAKMVNYSIG